MAATKAAGATPVAAVATVMTSTARGVAMSRVQVEVDVGRSRKSEPQAGRAGQGKATSPDPGWAHVAGSDPRPSWACVLRLG
jgi:hypothetical protein